MSEFIDWYLENTQDALAQPALFDVRRDGPSYPDGAQQAASGDFMQWYQQNEGAAAGYISDAPADQSWEFAGTATPGISAGADFMGWYDDAKQQRPQRERASDLSPPPSYWSDSAEYTTQTLPYPAYRERQRRRFRPNLAAVGAVVLAVSLAATALLGQRGHGEAHSAPSQPAPTAPASPNPGKATSKGSNEWRPVLTHNGTVIDLDAAEWDAAHEPVPKAVAADKSSVVKLTNYDSDWNADCTAYIDRTPVGTRTFTAAHCVVGNDSEGSGDVKLPLKYYVLPANIGGSEHVGVVTGYQAAPSYQKKGTGDLQFDTPSTDLASVDIRSNFWVDGNKLPQFSDSGIESLTPIQNSDATLEPGTLVYTWGYRPGGGALELTPPAGPVLQKMVFVGYTSKGHRMVFLPLDLHRAPFEQEGNSGAPYLNKAGRAIGTLVVGGVVNNDQLKGMFGLTAKGGDGAYIGKDKRNKDVYFGSGYFDYEIGTTNDPADISMVTGAPVVHTETPTFYP